jgi:hypothetical protein
MSDKNQFVLSGDNTGSVWVNNVLTYRASDLGMREIRIASVVAGQGISDALKLSGVRRLTVYVGTLDARAAAEDAIDINHCHDCSIHIGELWPARKYCGTIKGASSQIEITVMRQHGHGTEVDWDYGNFSDQGNGDTVGCELNSQTADASPVTVRLLSATRPTIPNEHEQRYIITATPRGWFYPLYNFLKDFLATFRIKI